MKRLFVLRCVVACAASACGNGGSSDIALVVASAPDKTAAADTAKLQMTLKVVGSDAKPRPNRDEFQSGADYLRALHTASRSVRRVHYGVPSSRRAARLGEVLERSGLTPRRKQLAGTLSGGWTQRVALASATVHEPPLLFLDEPTAGVDPVSRREFWEQIHQLSARGTTIVVTTHYMDEAERCHEIAFIFRGQLLDTGTPREMVQRRGLRAAEASVEDASALAARLRADPRVDEVAHYGHLLRVCTRKKADPVQLVRELSQLRPEQALDAREVRPTVEDAFVSMVREDLSHAEPARGAA